MERISIFNYEAFYLDYLEGRLNQEDSALLLLFLESHPELIVEDGLDSFAIDENVVLNPKIKNSLKEVDETSSVSINVDHFIIAKIEGQLDEQKLHELDLFIANNGLIDLELSYKNTLLKPDPNIQFSQKKNLKRQQKIALWPLYAVAAVLLIAFLIWPISNDLKIGGFDDGLAMFSKEKPTKVTPNNPSTSVEEKVIINPYQKQLPSKETKNILVSGLNKRSLKTIFDLDTLHPITDNIYGSTLGSEELFKNLDVASNDIISMKNPIPVITKIITEKTNRKVDLLISEPQKKEGKSFFIKLGRLEISHKKAK